MRKSMPIDIAKSITFNTENNVEKNSYANNSKMYRTQSCPMNSKLIENSLMVNKNLQKKNTSPENIINIEKGSRSNQGCRFYFLIIFY